MAVVNQSLPTVGLQLAEYFLQLQEDLRYDLDAEVLVDSLQQLILTPDYFCSQTIKVCPQLYEAIKLEDDIRSILKDMPVDASDYVNQLYREIASSETPRDTIRFVQFSDAHLDMLYKEGTSADCGLHSCCREESQNKNMGDVLAGYWGAVPNSSNTCDVPMHTFQNALDKIKSLGLDSDTYLFWTGDSTAHDDIWVTQAEVTETLETIISTVQSTFSEQSDSLFASLGNHDSFPNGDWNFSKEEPAESVRNLLHEWVPQSQWELYD